MEPILKTAGGLEMKASSCYSTSLEKRDFFSEIRPKSIFLKTIDPFPFLHRQKKRSNSNQFFLSTFFKGEDDL